MQTLTDLSPNKLADSLEIERKEAIFDCPIHGPATVIITKLYQWSTPYCPACKAEEERLQAVREEQKRQEEKQAKIAMRLRQSNIPPRFQGKDFSNYAPSSIQASKTLNMCRSYAERFPDFAGRGTSIILCGMAGTGKTHLACAIASHIITHHGKSALYQHVSSSLRQVKETYQKGSKRTEQEAINSFIPHDLLILDEVGVQFGTDVERNILFEIINSRYEQMKPTILISNLDMKGLVDYAGERTIDRMKENGGLMRVFDWKSYRGIN